MLSIELDPAIEKRLVALALRTGRTENQCARELIESNIEDLEDRYLAESRLAKGQKPLTSAEMRAKLGLDD